MRKISFSFLSGVHREVKKKGTARRRLETEANFQNLFLRVSAHDSWRGTGGCDDTVTAVRENSSMIYTLSETMQ
jgi:hypothetical protein